MSIGTLGTNIGEFLIKIQNFSFMKMHPKMSSAWMAVILSRGDELNHPKYDTVDIFPSCSIVNEYLNIFSCDQAALWMVFSVRLSVCLSVCPSVTPFWLCSHHRIIMKFSWVITLDQGKVHAKGQGQRSKVKVTEVTTQIFVSGL